MIVNANATFQNRSLPRLGPQAGLRLQGRRCQLQVPALQALCLSLSATLSFPLSCSSSPFLPPCLFLIHTRMFPPQNLKKKKKKEKEKEEKKRKRLLTILLHLQNLGINVKLTASDKREIQGRERQRER